MNCDALRLTSFLDGELSPAEASVVVQHIAECPTCAAQVAEHISLQHQLRAAKGRFLPTPEFKGEFLKSMHAQIAAAQTPPPIPAKPRRQAHWRTPALLATLATAAALLIASLLWLGNQRDDFREVADLHTIALSSATPVDVVSTDRHTVKPWFQGRLPFSFNIPELAGSGFSLGGGRMVYLHQQPGAHLIVALRRHNISVLIFQDSAEMARLLPASAGRRNAFSIESWSGAGLRFVAIGDADPADLHRLALAMQAVNP